MSVRAGVLPESGSERDQLAIFGYCPEQAAAEGLTNFLELVPGAGIEPARPEGHRILSPERLPVPPPRPGELSHVAPTHLRHDQIAPTITLRRFGGPR